MVHCPVAGFQTAAELLTPVSWLSAELPPVARTRPSANTEAETHWRRVAIACVVVTTGCGPVMSMTIAPLELPPICRILPGRYIAALDVEPALVEENCPAVVS